MSAFVVSKTHIDAIITGALTLCPSSSRLTWMERDLTPEEEQASHQEGSPWGPEAVEIWTSLRRELDHDTAERVGQMLWAENVRSVNHRYAEEEWEEIYTFTRLPISGHIDPMVILDAIGCYEYQSCEHPEWERSEAYRFCQALKAHAIDALPRRQKVWEINDPQVFRTTAKAS